MGQETSVGSWGELEQKLNDFRQSHTGNNPLLFRGQSNACWPLNTTLDRMRKGVPFQDYYEVICSVRAEIETVTGKKWKIPEYAEIEKLVTTLQSFSPTYEYMAYLRHYGFPSPLLDWSSSPYVAAFFAFEKAIIYFTTAFYRW
jgi:hypothetical protein